MKYPFTQTTNEDIRSVRGFTLIEILVVIGMLAILATMVIVAVNPLHQFAEARNSQRVDNVNTIVNAIGERLAEHGGVFGGVPGCDNIPTTETIMGSEDTEYDIRHCLVPTYLSELPVDPASGINSCTTIGCEDGHYETDYSISYDNDLNRITVCSPRTTNDGMAKPYCLTR